VDGSQKADGGKRKKRKGRRINKGGGEAKKR
jgi:hypothetical protein